MCANRSELHYNMKRFEDNNMCFEAQHVDFLYLDDTICFRYLELNAPDHPEVTFSTKVFEMRICLKESPTTYK